MRRCPSLLPVKDDMLVSFRPSARRPEGSRIPRTPASVPDRPLLHLLFGAASDTRFFRAPRRPGGQGEGWLPRQVFHPIFVGISK